MPEPLRNGAPFPAHLLHSQLVRALVSAPLNAKEPVFQPDRTTRSFPTLGTSSCLPCLSIAVFYPFSFGFLHVHLPYIQLSFMAVGSHSFLGIILRVSGVLSVHEASAFFLILMLKVINDNWVGKPIWFKGKHLKVNWDSSPNWTSSWPPSNPGSQQQELYFYLCLMPGSISQWDFTYEGKIGEWLQLWEHDAATYNKLLQTIITKLYPPWVKGVLQLRCEMWRLEM